MKHVTLMRWLAAPCWLLACCMMAHSSADEVPEEFPAEAPSEHHQAIAMDVGTWDAEMKIYMGVPDAPPMVMPAKEVNTMMPGGLWMISQFESGPFQGHGQFGYDSTKNKYVGTWIDNTSSHMSVMEGDYDKEAKQLVMRFTGINTMTRQPEKMKSVAKYVDDDTRHFTMYRMDADSGEWVRSFEIDYRRAS